MNHTHLLCFHWLESKGSIQIRHIHHKCSIALDESQLISQFISRTYIDYPQVLNIMSFTASLAFGYSLDDIKVKIEYSWWFIPINNGYGNPTEANCGSWKNIVNQKKWVLICLNYLILEGWGWNIAWESRSLSHHFVKCISPCT